MRRTLSALLVSLAGLGCSGSGGGTSTSPASLQIVSGDAQVAPIGTELPDALVVKVLDAAGTPVAGQTVNFRVVAGGGSVFAGVGTTNSNGIAQERWTLGTTSGPQRLEARAVDATTGAAIVFGTFSATAVAGPPASITLVSGGSQDGSLSYALPNPVVVGIKDSYGNPVQGASVSFVPTSGGGAANPALVLTDANGTASTIWTLGPQTGMQTLDARVTDLPALVVDANFLACSPAADFIFHQLQGTWATCAPISATSSMKNTLVVSGCDVTIANTLYGGAASPDLTCTGTGIVAALGVGNLIILSSQLATFNDAPTTSVFAYQLDLTGTITPTGGSATPFAMYTIGYVNRAGTTLYLGDTSGANDGTTPAKRPTVLDGHDPYVQQ